MNERVSKKHANSCLNRYSVAMTDETKQGLHKALLREDGQEDLCMAVYQTSTGSKRTTAILKKIIMPKKGETIVHGIVSFTGDYVLRAAAIAAELKGGLAILHSHPSALGWQGMSGPDKDAESSFAYLVKEITGLPLVGMTLAGHDRTWSARFWNADTGNNIRHIHCESVRVIGNSLKISWNPKLMPPSNFSTELTRTISCWGNQMQTDIELLRILIVGAGTLGLDVAVRLAATGIKHIAIMDYDTIKVINLDRLIGATPIDAFLFRSKLEIAVRELRQNATADNFLVEPIEGSICEPNQFNLALDYDLVFSCIDNHPWPRSILNTLAYTDLIPVIDGGINVDAFADGDGMRNATWRSHVLRPGRPCMACNGQLDLGKVHADKAGLLDDEKYISGLPSSEKPNSQNVAVLAASASASMLSQFVSFVIAPANSGEPGPLRYQLNTHWLEHVEATTRNHCPVEQNALAGDRRQVLLGDHPAAHMEISKRKHESSRLIIKFYRKLDDIVSNIKYFVIDKARLSFKQIQD